MELNLSAEQVEIRDSVASFLGREVPFDTVKQQSAGDGFDATTWSRCVELGWIALGISEEAGGVGYGIAEEVVLAREIGRHLTPGPFLPTIVAAHVAELAGAGDLLAALVSGEQPVGLGVGELVVDGTEGGLALVIGDEVAQIVRIVGLETRECVDPTVRLGRARLGDVLAETSSEPVGPLAALLFAAASLGVAEFTMHQSVEYAKVREQFGRPIGSFQAIKHRCADMAIRCYSAFAQLAAATVSVEAASPDATLQVDAAVLLCLEAARLNAAENIQVHGGIGFTDEHSAGWYLKRAQVLEQMAGSRHRRTERLVGARRMEFA